MQSAGHACRANGSTTTRCGCNCTRWPATWPPCLTLHRATRGHGRLVSDEPAIEVDQDGCSRGTSRPRHHFHAGRGRGHRRDCPRHPRRHPPNASVAVMCMALKPHETARKRQDRSVTRAGKRCLPTKVRRVRSLICRHSGVLAHVDAAPGAKHLNNWQKQAILTHNHTPHWECRLEG